MSSYQQNEISEQGENPLFQIEQIPNTPTISNYSNPDYLNQGFVVYSDEDIFSQNSNSQALSSAASNLSSGLCHSSFNSLLKDKEHDRLERQQRQDECQNQTHGINADDHSENGISRNQEHLALFKKRFEKSVVKFGPFSDGCWNQQKQKIEVDQSDKSMVKQYSFHLLNEKQVKKNENLKNGCKFESKYQISLDKLKLQNINKIQLLANKSQKKQIPEESQISQNSIERITSNQSRHRHSSDYVSKITKEYILASRKEKKIKKLSSKSNRILKGYKKQKITFGDVFQ